VLGYQTKTENGAIAVLVFKIAPVPVVSHPHPMQLVIETAGICEPRASWALGMRLLKVLACGPLA